MAVQKLKKILLIRNAFAFDVGGAESFPVMMAQVLKANGLQTVIVSRHKGVLGLAKQNNIATIKGLWWSQQNWSGVRTALSPLYLLWQIILTVWYLQLFVRIKPDVIHAQSKDDFIAATIAGKLLRKRVVWTDHADLKYVFANQNIWYKNPVGKLVYCASTLANAIAIVSQGEWRLIEQTLGRGLNKKRFVLIYNGVLDKQVVAFKRPGELTKSIIFSCSSRLVTTKGIGELIKAYKNIHSTYPNTHLWLIGDGPEAESFKLMAKDEPSIEFLGFSDNPLTYVKASDIFIHPSYNEAFSLSLIEATMLGKPIIACDVGGNSEIVHDGSNGILVSVKNVVALKDAMEKLVMDSDKREKYGKASRKYYEEQFVFETIVKDKYIPLYEK